MFYYFESLARLVVIVVSLFSVAALTASQLKPVGAEGGSRLASSWDSLSGEYFQGDARVHLIDRADGRTTTIAAPEGERWNYISASPWKNQDEGVEAVGRFTRSSRPAADSGSSVCGLVRLRLPEAEVIERVDLDIIPSGRPAWNPVGDGQILIPAGNGRLYSYRFASRSDEVGGLIATPEHQATVGADLMAVEWRCQAPGQGEPFLSDPVWPTIPELQNLVIVSLSAMTADDSGRPRYGATALWWLELSGDGEQIVAAGPLIDPSDDPNGSVGVRRRFPNVVARDGRIQLAYLVSRTGGSEAELRVGDLERGSNAGRLRLRFDSAAEGAARPFPIGHLSASWDGRWIHGFSHDLGRIVSLPLATDDGAPGGRASDPKRLP
ncbi:MAG: hypothetical protein P4L85_07015 [Paludisphaera borealis]|uniref:hypothetical protein n=1 Tax=Paludisphaera borealis TaxID=1387353 RepID=UPI0028472903|nr:hypothetical protein [Paludisphaera borealis]MDR3619086.1 hypothetical protein [Paludisphaera borealis]